ncbi:MAG: acyltransferase, partial [Pseudomonadota bacterium]
MDGIRAVSILLVFLSHAGASKLIPGGFGVTIFFFLSGYLITTLLQREYDQYNAISFRAFYLRRALRLGPPIFFTMAVAMGLGAMNLVEADFSAAAALSQIFFFYNYFSLLPGAGENVVGLGILWSLSVEEHFYLIWPAMFIAVMRGWIGARSVVALLAIILLWRCVRFFVFQDPEWPIYISTDTRFDSLLYGCLLAMMTADGTAARIFAPSARAKILWLAGATGALLLTFIMRDDAFRSTIRYTLQGIALAPIFYYAVTTPKDVIFQPLNWGPVKRVGVWSYTIYLCHFAIIHGLEYNQISTRGDPAFILLAAALSCGFAAAVHQWVERPCKP